MDNLSYQLYSSRKFTPLAGTVKMLAELGYTEVEGFGGLYNDPAPLRAMLDDAGLTMPTGHIGIDALADDFAGSVTTAKTLGIKTLICPAISPSERPGDAAGWTAFGEKLDAICQALADRGIGFAWHNHNFEFASLPDGSMPMQRILDAAPKLQWEIDIAWVIRGGQDPIDWIKAQSGRIIAVHLKDIAPNGKCADEDGWADVGHGTIDWPPLLQALKSAPVASFVMEHDNPNDDKRFAARSIAAAAKF